MDSLLMLRVAHTALVQTPDQAPAANSGSIRFLKFAVYLAGSSGNQIVAPLLLKRQAEDEARLNFSSEMVVYPYWSRISSPLPVQHK
jgi:hypothetical protein